MSMFDDGTDLADSDEVLIQREAAAHARLEALLDAENETDPEADAPPGVEEAYNAWSDAYNHLPEGQRKQWIDPRDIICPFCRAEYEAELDDQLDDESGGQ